MGGNVRSRSESNPARERIHVGLSHRERVLITDIEHDLATFRLDRAATEVAPLIRQLLGVNIAALCSPEIRDGRVVLERVDTDGDVMARYLPELTTGMHSGELSFAFSVRAPELRQRNRPVVVPGARSVEHQRLGISSEVWLAMQERLHRLVALHDRHGIVGHTQTRTLICDGPLLLRYFNVMHERPLDARQRRLYRALLKPIHGRAVLDHRMTMASCYRAALDVTLESLGCAAFIVRRNGQVVHANQIGRVRLTTEHDLPQRLLQSIAGRHHGFVAHAIATNGTPSEYLVTARRADLQDVARLVAVDLQLGRRTTEVLVLLAAAQPNKLIAANMGIQEGTVEFHVTSLFRRLGVASRAELHRLLVDRLR